MDEWHTISLREANVSLIDCEHRTPPKAASGVPYVAIPQIKNGRIDVTAARRISQENFIEWTRKAAPQPYDVVLSRRCNPGETAFVPPGLDFALGQNLVLLRADGTKVHPPFLRWLVRGTDWWEQIGKFINVGAVFDSLKCADIPSFRLPIPPLSEQRGISQILGALDDKIELNQRMNETLEAIARAIFKSWFLDFDPVRAKSEGRQPFGMNTETVALFPDSFQEFPLGKIPKGWKVGPILARSKLLSGGTPKTDREEYWKGNILWASAKDVSQSRQTFLLETERSITERGLAESATQLIPRFCTVIVARGATTGRMAILGCEMAMNQTCYALTPTGNTPFFLYCLLQHEVGQLVHAAHGSVFDTITTDTFARSSIVLPPEPVVEAFEIKVAPLFQRILANTIESSTLASTRDLLLPKLISGEIRINHEEVSSGGTR